MHIVHIQCLLRVDGSILAGVFLTSSFCVVPESSYSSNAVISSLVIVQLLYCSCSTESMVTSFKNFHTKVGTRCRDGVNVLWCRSYLVWLFFEGSIPTCACLHSENFFVTCDNRSHKYNQSQAKWGITLLITASRQAL